MNITGMGKVMGMSIVHRRAPARLVEQAVLQDRGANGDGSQRWMLDIENALCTYALVYWSLVLQGLDTRDIPKNKSC